MPVTLSAARGLAQRGLRACQRAGTTIGNWFGPRYGSVLVLLGLLLAGCGQAPPDPPLEVAGDVAHGRLAIQQYGCGVCHRIPGIKGADGNVGPPLDEMAKRVYLAGVLANTPENLARWIRTPQAIAPLTAMPDMGVNEVDARAIAAYLYRPQ